MNVVYTFMLETHKKYRMPYMKNDVGCEWGNSAHSISARISPRIGAKMYGEIFAGVGFTCSFVNSLIASANGCGNPISITLFGPLRS